MLVGDHGEQLKVPVGPGGGVGLEELAELEHPVGERARRFLRAAAEVVELIRRDQLAARPQPTVHDRSSLTRTWPTGRVEDTVRGRPIGGSDQVAEALPANSR